MTENKANKMTRIKMSGAAQRQGPPVDRATGWSGSGEIAGTGYLCGACRDPLPVGALVCGRCGVTVGFEDEPGALPPLTTEFADRRPPVAPTLSEVAATAPVPVVMALTVAVVALVMFVFGLQFHRDAVPTQVVANEGAIREPVTAPPATAAATTTTTRSRPDPQTTAFCAVARRYPLTTLTELGSRMLADREAVMASYRSMVETAPRDLQGYVEGLRSVTEQANNAVRTNLVKNTEHFRVWLALVRSDDVAAWNKAQQSLVPVLVRICD